MIESDFRKLEKLFLALGDKTRLRLLALMAHGEVPVGVLAERLGESQPKVSRHLAYLRNAGVVYTRRDGKWIFYGISYPKDELQRQMLETVVRSIPVAGIDGESNYFTAADTSTDGYLKPENNIYVQADIYKADAVEVEDIYVETDMSEQVSDDAPGYAQEDMDVFLL